MWCKSMECEYLPIEQCQYPLSCNLLKIYPKGDEVNLPSHNEIATVKTESIVFL